MRTSSLVPAALITVCTTLACASQSTSVGGFALEVPNGWEAEPQDADTLALGTKQGEWTFVLVTFGADGVDEGKSLDAVGRDVAEQIAADHESQSGGTTLRFGEPESWTRAGLEGVTLDGTMVDGEVELGMKMLVIAGGDRFMVAFGFRGANAGDKDDAAAQAMLDSIRKG